MNYSKKGKYFNQYNYIKKKKKKKKKNDNKKAVLLFVGLDQSVIVF